MTAEFREMSDDEIHYTRRIFEELLDERFRQDEKFGIDWLQSDLLSFAILGEEFGEVAKEVVEQQRAKMRTELVQVAAVAVKWIHSLDESEKQAGLGLGSR
jgi:hypothetical protein